MKLSELKDILDAHDLWLRSDGKQGKRADLRDANLRGAKLLGANLEGANLRGAVLRGADLRGADLQDANLQGVILQGANLQGADLQDADLRFADLHRANLQGATFDLNFKQVGWFFEATFSEDQIAWVCLHPKFHECADTLKWVKAEQLSA